MIIGSILRRSFSSKKICIVGAGPAGFYAAQYILKTLTDCQVDLIEKLPVPFGLVRFGVAPDHPEVKNVINTFTKTAENPRFKFFGNVTLGKDISLQQLRGSYHAVLLAYGADQDRKLGIKHEEQNNVLSARNFVAWYNGLPGVQNMSPNLNVNNVTIVGQGNVAVDVARILLSPVDALKKTDITAYALDTLSSSRVQRVYLVGRRSPLQVAFTIKELREMLKLPNVTTKWRPKDFEAIPDLDTLPRPRKRLTELMLKSLNDQQTTESKNSKEFLPIFLRSPKCLNNDKIKFTVNRMEQDEAIATADEETLPAELLLRSIGYKSSCVDKDIYFNSKMGKVYNENGRVHSTLKDVNSFDNGLYVAGWLGTGPTGVILTTMNSAFAVAKTICDDILSNKLSTDSFKQGAIEFLKTKRVVSWEGWQKINKEEMRRGLECGKPREKIVNIDEMLNVATG